MRGSVMKRGSTWTYVIYLGRDEAGATTFADCLDEWLKAGESTLRIPRTDQRKPRAKPDHLDIISDVTWNVELEPEVEEWLDTLSPTEFALALPHIERLAERGNRLRLPASKPLGDGLFELRFDLALVALRIPFFFATGRRIVLLTVFRKQRMNERSEINRARAAMVRCIAEGHTAEEE